MNKRIVKLENVFFGYAGSEKYLLRDISLSVLSKDKIGLVGANGIGKTTLFKLFQDKLKPLKGDVQITGNVVLLPQLNVELLDSNDEVYEYLQKENEQWWTILEHAKQYFNVSIDPNRIINTLSGGEIVKMLLSKVLVDKPDLLLLDEPTNHLDILSREILAEHLKNLDIAYVIISHDTYFLDNTVNKIWEIEENKIVSYGGNYSGFLNLKEQQRQGHTRQLEQATRELDKLEKQKLLDDQKSAQRRKQTLKNRSGMPKILLGYKEGRAQSGMRRQAKKYENIEARAKARLDTFKIPAEIKASLINIDKKKEKSKGNIFNLKDERLKVKDTTLIEDINFRLDYSDRVVITGENGSGKTLLIKSALGLENFLRSPYNKKQNLEFAYLDQKLSIINMEKTLKENFLLFNPEISQALIKEQMARFKFDEYQLNSKAKTLSGGEFMRLALALITSKKLDVLVLDEPTNNLDVKTRDVLMVAINNFTGAVCVISHDIEFLAGIRIETAYVVHNKRLLTLLSLPKDKDLFYKELLQKELSSKQN